MSRDILTFSGCRSVRLALIVASAFPVAAAVANTAVWTGGSNTSDNFNDSANWENGSAPDGSPSAFSVVQFSGSTRLNPQNNYGAYTQFGQVLFSSGAGPFTLSGAAIKLYTNTTTKIENNSIATQVIDLNSDGNSIGFNTSGELDPTQGDLTVNHTVYFDGGGQLNVYGNNGHTLTLNGALNNGSATTSLVIRDNSNVKLTASNFYSGGTAINGGRLYALNSTGSATGSNSVTIGGGGMLTGTGSVSGAVSVSGKISAGSNSGGSDTIGTLATGDQTWNGGGAYLFKLQNTAGSTNSGTQTGNAGINWDKLKMSGLTIAATSGSKFTIIITPLAQGMSFTTGAKFEIANVTSGSAPSDLSTMFVLDASRLGLPDSSFSLTTGAGGAGESGYDVFLSYGGGNAQSAPEPASVMLSGMAGGVLLTRRRRR
ncbi:MAG: hypothetical protein JWM57_580 [Phycisphaerales bacterium]|nr:hypothetical protein [Phycisphaerales bacterium]